jgi:NADH-quinone oxidoreductase subunit K
MLSHLCNGYFLAIQLDTAIQLSIYLFVVGLVGISFNKESFIKLMLSVELMYLGILFGFIFVSIYLEDFLGQIMPLFILSLVAAETAVGCGILIITYKNYGTINLLNFVNLRF